VHIINNRNKNNHLSRLIACFKDAEEIIIVSPFITANFDFFPFEKFKQLRKITIITRLKPYTADQYDKVAYLDQLWDYAGQNEIQLDILIDNSLHGKIYIANKKGHFCEGLITSANFNLYGLKINNEWGVMINDEHELDILVKNLFDHIVLQPLTRDLLTSFKNKIALNPLPSGKIKVKLNLAKQLTLKPNPLNITATADFWLKPIGVTGDIVPWGEPRTDIHEQLHFAVYPRAVKPGHIILTYAVGHTCFLSVYRVISEIRTTADSDDRWHYYVIGENLTPFYGSEWHQHYLTIGNQKNEALSKKLGNVTPSGKNSFGSFNRGADKLRITVVFANYVIDKMTSINNAIATRVS
jgi:HKD family nuclease